MSPSPSLQELLAAIDGIADELEALARPAEAARRAPDELAALVKAARIPMAKVPREVGGYELSPAEQIDLFARLAWLNPTASWLAFNQCGVAGVFAATLPDDGVAEVFAEDAPVAAAVSAPTGKSEKVDGGYRVSGRWAYASGVHVAQWVGLFTLADDPPGPRLVALRRDQVELQDDWHVAALQGTGSVDVIVDGAFVPEHLTAVPFMQLRGGPQYTRLGIKGYVAGENFGFSLGVAQRLVHEIAALSTTKKRYTNVATVSERGAFRHALAQADCALRASRAYLMSELDGAMATVTSSGALLPAEDMSRLEAASAWATEQAIQTAVKLFPYAGAGALHLSNPIQRALRDLIGSGQHIVVSNEGIDAWGETLVRIAGRPG